MSLKYWVGNKVISLPHTCDQSHLKPFGGRCKVNLVKKGMFLRIFFSDTDSVSSFSQFPYNNATFEQYFPKFSLQNIEN